MLFIVVDGTAHKSKTAFIYFYLFYCCNNRLENPFFISGFINLLISYANKMIDESTIALE